MLILEGVEEDDDDDDGQVGFNLLEKGEKMITFWCLDE
jgi:hypothetical protein